MKIRIANENDIDELIKLIQLADNRTLEVASRKVNRFIKSDKGFFIIAIENNKIIGYLLLTIKEEDENASKFLDITKFLCICWIAVHPKFRGQKIGTKLLQESEKYVKKYEKIGIWLDCREKVIEFYKNNGFKEAGKYNKTKLSGESNPCHVMIKKVN